MNVGKMAAAAAGNCFVMTGAFFLTLYLLGPSFLRALAAVLGALSSFGDGWH